MGMDVVGRLNNDAYFRNNVWWWRPLWDYCIEVAPDLCGGVNGHFNDGDGLDEENSLALAKVLRSRIDSGHTMAYQIEYYRRLSTLPRSKCVHCAGTGIRTDAVGVKMGMPTRELEADLKVLLGRDAGWCNGCRGEGSVEHFDANYPFSVENVEEFADFLEECGGFSIF
jgi:hypothetical protein